MRIAITGMGLVSCLGRDLGEVSRALQAGRSGIGRDAKRVELGFRSALTGLVPDVDVREHVNRRQAKSIGQPAAYAVAAAHDALRHAQLPAAALQSERAGVIVGNDSCAAPAVEIADTLRQAGETRLIGSGKILQVMNSTVTINLATLFGIQGAAWTLSGACASGAHAIGQAFLLIGMGLQDVVLCGGAQEVSWESMASFDAIGAFAPDDGDPAEASRPFDAGRRGLVPSGGAAMLVVESWEHAQRRGAPILAEVIGYAFSSDGEDVTQPNGKGAVRAMRAVLAQARRTPEEVEYVNAHATGTPVGDVVEGKALLEVFGRAGRVPVSSTKSMTGHECWMAGASEIVYSTLMMQDGFIAPNRNLARLDPELEGLDVVAVTRPTRPRLCLSNSFGFGGTNAALLIERPEA